MRNPLTYNYQLQLYQEQTMNISEISSKRYHQITPLLGKYIDYPVVNAIIENNSPGCIYVDDTVAPKSAFVCTNAGFSYLVGSSQNEGFNLELKGFLENELFPKIKKSDDPTLIFYPLSDGWEIPLKNILGEQTFYDLFRKQFTFNQNKFVQQSNWQDQIPAGFSLNPIDQDLLDNVRADMAPWESPHAFLEKGFGFWLMKGEDIVSECSSVFSCDAAVEINIHTEEKYQRQGFAKITASAFVEECLARGLRPNWECWWDNVPSVSLAQKLGFEPICDHAVFLVELN